jgi:hypothetical protein
MRPSPYPPGASRNFLTNLIARTRHACDRWTRWTRVALDFAAEVRNPPAEPWAMGVALRQRRKLGGKGIENLQLCSQLHTRRASRGVCNLAPGARTRPAPFSFAGSGLAGHVATEISGFTGQRALSFSAVLGPLRASTTWRPGRGRQRRCTLGGWLIRPTRRRGGWPRCSGGATR